MGSKKKYFIFVKNIDFEQNESKEILNEKRAPEVARLKLNRQKQLAEPFRNKTFYMARNCSIPLAIPSAR
jgi:hypothetical protein